MNYSKPKISSSLKRRICALEQAIPARDAPVLVILGCVGRSSDEMVDVYGLNVPRLAGEVVTAYIERLERHIRKTRGRRVPFVGLALYADDVD